MGILPMCRFFVFKFNGKDTAETAVILMGGTPMLRNNLEVAIVYRSRAA
jgi:hypothetical protein